MATLYELDKAIETVIEGGLIFSEETGEVIWDADNLNELEAAFEDKLEGCAIFIKNLAAEAAAIKAEETALAERRKTIERKADRMRSYVVDCLQDKVTAHKFSTPRVSLSLRRSEQVIISDSEAIAPEFMTVRTTETPNKAKIRKALKAGAEVAGAALVENANLQIR